jgi:transposase
MSVLADCGRGLGTREVATKYAVSQSWVRQLKQRRRQTGEVAPRQPTTGPRTSWEAYAGRLREAVRQAPDAMRKASSNPLYLPIGALDLLG